MKIPDLLFFPDHQEYIPGHSTQSPEILVLQVGSIAPTVNLNCHLVVTL